MRNTRNGWMRGARAVAAVACVTVVAACGGGSIEEQTQANGSRPPKQEASAVT